MTYKFSTFILFFYSLSFSIGLSDISPVRRGVGEFNQLIEMLERDVEPYCRDWTRNWQYDVSRGYVQSVLENSLSRIKKSVWSTDLFSTILAEGIIYHYLYQLEVDSAFFKADSIADYLITEFPSHKEGPWLKGVNLVKAGEINRGFDILDSLQRGGLLFNNSFISDYSKLSAKAFIPSFTQKRETFVKASKPLYISPKERKPINDNWEVINQSTNGHEISNFTFTEIYELKQSLRIPRPKLWREKLNKIPVYIDSNITKNIKQPLLWQPDHIPTEVKIKIIIDRSNDGSSLYQFVNSFIDNRFDALWEEDNINRKHAISLRAIIQSGDRKISSQYFAYTAFDIFYLGNRNSFYRTPLLPKSKRSEYRKVRVLVSMTTRRSVEDKAEKLYRDIMSKF